MLLAKNHIQHTSDGYIFRLSLSKISTCMW